MKYLKDKNSRRRGVAIELAVGMLLIMMAMSTIIVVTTMIQIEKQKNSVIDLNNLITDIERIEYNQVGLYFESIVYDEILSLDSFGDSEDETIRSRKTLNDLSFLFLTNDDQDDQQLLKSNVETFQNEIVKSLKDKLEQKFEVLKNHRSLEFEITIGDIYKDDNTNPISPITQINYIDEEEGDIVTKTKTIVLEYNLTFALNLNVVNGETSRTVFSVENNMVLNREASLVSKYIKQYKLIPIEEEVKYTIENEFVELYLKEGHYLSFKGKEGIES